MPRPIPEAAVIQAQWPMEASEAELDETNGSWIVGSPEGCHVEGLSPVTDHLELAPWQSTLAEVLRLGGEDSRAGRGQVLGKMYPTIQGFGLLPGLTSADRELLWLRVSESKLKARWARRR